MRVYIEALGFFLFASCFRPHSLAQEPQFIFGHDSQIHGVVLNHSQEQSTRETMQLSDTCNRIKARASAMALIGSEGSSVSPRLHSPRGIVVLEGLTGAEPKILDTEFLSAYKTYATSFRGEMGMQPGPRYPLAVTLAATGVGSDDLEILNGEKLMVHADGQLYAYSLPSMTIPSEGLIRLYLGTDDTLYYDAVLTHPIHAGACQAGGGHE